MQRERITITIETDLLGAVDELIDHSKIRNRSHAIEYAIRSGLALHEIRHAFFILGNTFPSGALLADLFAILANLGILTCYFVSEPGKLADAETLASTLRQTQPSLSITALPGDFGTAGALLLRQTEVTGSMLIIDLSQVTLLPAALQTAYSFHRQRNRVLTQLLHSSDGLSYTSSGFTFAQPELFTTIPPGIASLQESVFPALVKAGKVSTYAY